MSHETQKKYFLGWTNVKFIISEIAKIYSSKPSFLSKKRMESGVAFIIAQWGMIYFLSTKIDKLTMSDFAWWAAIEFGVAGYIINQIQKEKKGDQ